jgi:GMP synthase (glutamine-hydrolysing)
MRVHFVVHEAFEAPGAYARWALDRQHTVTYSRLHAGESLPSAAEDIDLLIVMGGPQSPATTTAECPHFDAVAEMSLIASCAAAGKAVVGVCLGAQLLGEALGAPCLRSPEPEVGSFPVTLTEAGRRHPLFEGFDESFDSGHWHHDMPGLTADARVLAASEGCPRQIVAYGRFLYGFQCHLEFDRDVVEALIESAEEELAALADHRFVQRPEQLRRNDHRAMNERLEVFLDRLVADYTAA